MAFCRLSCHGAPFGWQVLGRWPSTVHCSFDRCVPGADGWVAGCARVTKAHRRLLFSRCSALRRVVGRAGADLEKLRRPTVEDLERLCGRRGVLAGRSLAPYLALSLQPAVEDAAAAAAAAGGDDGDGAEQWPGAVGSEQRADTAIDAGEGSQPRPSSGRPTPEQKTPAETVPRKPKLCLPVPLVAMQHLPCEMRAL